MFVWGSHFSDWGAMAKDNLPQTIGSLPAIQLPCAFFSAVLIPFGSLLALRGLILQKGPWRSLLSYHLIALIFVPVILSWYFATSILMTHVLDLGSTSQHPSQANRERKKPSERTEAHIASKVGIPNLRYDYRVPSR